MPDAQSRGDLPVSVDVVVERQLLILFDVPLSVYPHSDMLPNRPFRYVAIRIAAVVRKTPDSASFRRVDELRGRGGKCLHKHNDGKDEEGKPCGVPRPFATS